MIQCPTCGFASHPDLNFCGRCGRPLKAPGAGPQPQPPAPGEMRLVTVLMADISGSTELLEKLGTEQWVTLMKNLLQKLGAEVYRFGGRVDQFRGDGLVAFFGSVGAHEDDSERAVLAALAMQEMCELDRSLNVELDGFSGPLRLRIGIHTGEVVVGKVGDERLHQEDTAMGRAIALASRLENQAAPGAIWVSQATYETISGRFDWREIGSVRLRGFSELMPVYQPLAPRLEESRSPVFFGGDLLARPREVHQVLQKIEELRQFRQGGVITLSGARGMGKSQLMEQVRRALNAKRATSPQITWLHGRCRSYEQSIPFALWRSLLFRYFGIREGEDSQAIRRQIEAQTRALDPALASEFLPWLLRFFGMDGRPAARAAAANLTDETAYDRFLEAEDMPRSALERTHGELERQTLFHQANGYLRAISRLAPVVILFENLQWADETSLACLNYCLPALRHYPILFVLSTRPELPLSRSGARSLLEKIEERFPGRHQHIQLDPLGATERHARIGEAVGRHTLPDDLQALLVTRAEGNPYFLEQLLQSLMRQGALVQMPQTGRWQLVQQIDSLELPSSLQSLLQARLDLLPPDARKLLQQAAVAGAHFWTEVLENLPHPIPIKEPLALLEREGIVARVQPTPHLGWEFRFHSILLRDVVYQSLLTEQRRDLHRQTGLALEKLLGEDTRFQASLLVHHFHRAGDQTRELRYLLLAAETAEQAHADEESVALLDQADGILTALLEQKPGKQGENAYLDQRFSVLSRRLAIGQRLRDGPSAQRDAAALLQLAGRLKKRSRLIDAILLQPAVSSWREEADLIRGLEFANQAHQLAVQAKDRLREMRSLMALARLGRFRGNPEAVAQAERALFIAREIGDRQAEVYLLIWLGTTFDWIDEPERAQPYFDQAYPLTRELNDKEAEIELLKQTGLRAERAGDYYRSLTDYHERRRQLARRTGNRLAEAQAAMLQGMVRGIYLGDLQAGLEELISGRRLWQGTGVEAIALVYIAHILILQGAFEAAGQALDHPVEQTGSLNNDIVRTARALVRAMWHNEQGGLTHWHSALGEAAAVLVLTRERPLLSRQFSMAAAVQATIAHLGLGSTMPEDQVYHLERALDFASEGLKIYRQTGFTQITECVGESVLYWHGRALAAVGRQAAALASYREAYGEMRRKWRLIPEDSHFRQTYIDQLPIHQLIVKEAETHRFLEED